MQTCCCQYWMQHQFLRPKSCQQIEVISAKVCNQLKLVKNAPDSRFEEKNKQLDCIQKIFSATLLLSLPIQLYPRLKDCAHVVVSLTYRLCVCWCIPNLQTIPMLLHPKIIDCVFVVVFQTYRLCQYGCMPDLKTVSM